MIRSYRNEDWPAVAEIYDLSKPDEMAGIVNPEDVVPLSRDGAMLRYFFDSEIRVYETDGGVRE